MRKQAENVEYESLEGMETVIWECVNAEQVWHNFMDRAITYNFEEIFHDMVFILHLICDVRNFKVRHPVRQFMDEAQKSEIMMKKVNKVLGDGIRKFLDYAIELKHKHPKMFDDMLVDYELSSDMREE